MKICPNCNLQLADDEIFCSNCGTKYSEPVAVQENPNKTCAQCGAEVEGRFCARCGAPYSKPVISAEQSKKICAFCGAEVIGNFCDKCGNPLGTVPPAVTMPATTIPTGKKPKKMNKTTIIAIILAVSAVLNIALIAVSIYLYSEKDYYYEKYYDLDREYDTISDEHEFFYEHARLVPDDGSDTYHRYGCEEFDDDNGFWIYNKERAEYEADPCDECCEDD